MKRILTGFLTVLCCLPVMAQVRTLDLGQRKIDISVLPQKGQDQFEQDYKLIMADDQMKSAYSTMVREKMRTFSGTEEERTAYLARIAHQIVEDHPATGTVTTATISPELSAQFAETRPTITRQVRVSSDLLIKKADQVDEIKQNSSGSNGDQPKPSAPASSNVFQGEIAYSIPDTMQIGEVYKVRLVVGIDPDVARQLADRQEGDTRSDQIGIGRYMKAELKDFYAFGEEEGAFEIDLWIGEPIQTINENDQDAAIIWEWRVRAMEPGSQMLGVKVSIILFDNRLPDGRGYQSIDSYEKPIQIIATGENQATATPSKPNSPTVTPPKQSDNLILTIGSIAGVFLLGIAFFFLTRSRQQKRYAAEQEASMERAIPNVQAGDGKADPEEIKALIKAGKFEEAAGELKDLALLTDYDDKAGIIALQARIQHWESDVHNNVIDGESARQERSRITLALIHVLESIQENQA